MKLSKKDLKDMMYWMVLGRRIEERITLLFKEPVSLFQPFQGI